MLLGVSFKAAFAVLSYFVTQATGTGPAMMGATAEQWTASELRPLRKRGWRVVNHLALRKWDIDHVLVGPGGAWAVETKWSAQPWKLDPEEDRVRAAVEQAQRNSTDLRRWQPFKSAAIRSVEPVVILWGATADEERPGAPTARRMDGALVLLSVEGCAQWRHRLLGADEHVLTQEQVDAAWQAMDRHAAQRDKHDRALAPSMLRIYARDCAVAVTAVASFLLSLHSLGWLGAWWLWGGLLAALGAAAALRHVDSVRWPVWGWLIGWSTSLLLVAGAVIKAIV